MKTQVFLSNVCPTCGRAASNPFRVWEGNKIRFGCVDHFHSGHLVVPSESAFFHGRPEAKRIRVADKVGRLGGVSEALQC